MGRIEETGAPSGSRQAQTRCDRLKVGGRESDRRKKKPLADRQATPQRGVRRRGGSAGRGGGTSRPEATRGHRSGPKRGGGPNGGMKRGKASRRGGLKMGPARGPKPKPHGPSDGDTKSNPATRAPNSNRREPKGFPRGHNSPKEKGKQPESSKVRGGGLLLGPHGPHAAPGRSGPSLRLGPHASGGSGTSQLRPGLKSHGGPPSNEKKEEIYDRVEVPADSPYLDTRKYVKMSSDIHSQLVKRFYTERGTGRRKRDVEEEMPNPTAKWPGWPDVSYWSRLTGSPPESSSESSVQE